MTSSAEARIDGDGLIAMRDFSASLPMVLLQTREAAMQLFRPLLAEHDLTEQQWRVLRALSATPEPIEVGAIVDATFLLAPSLSRILRDLEGRQLVRRSLVATDQRRAEISLTITGMTWWPWWLPRAKRFTTKSKKHSATRRYSDYCVNSPTCVTRPTVLCRHQASGH